MRIQGVSIVVAVLLVAAWSVPSAAAEANMDLSRAVIVVASPDKPVVAKAAVMLQEEIQKRTGISLAKAASPPKDDTAAIVLVVGAPPKELGTAPSGLAIPDEPDAYAIWVDTAKPKAPAVYLAGHDERGVLFAAGRLLRLVELRPNSISLSSGVRIATAPKKSIRGHQLGYRDTNNTTDAWTVAQHEQAFRDLIVFGANAVELTPDFDAKPRQSPHMVMDANDMDAKLCALIASYGLDVWIWFALRGNMADPALAEKELDRANGVFKNLPHLDAVYLPAGDPGETPAPDLLPFLVKLDGVLHQAHPEAKLWVSNQGFNDTQTDYLLKYLETEKPAWLTGLIFAPWAEISLKELRERTPERYLVRTCPDITHCVRCQYPVPHWDRAFAHTLGREGANPRPRAMQQIHATQMPYSEGFVTYSDGVHDDVNKTVWSACGWDPDARVEEVMREYGRYFFGEDIGPAIGEGLLAQEKSWVGPLKDNASVDATFKQWQDIEKKADDALKSNWRFQQGLMRAYYDEYDKQRLAIESEREAKAYAELKKANDIGPEAAIAAARKALVPPNATPEAPELRKRIEELGAALFKSIGAQLSVKKPFLASGPERGAILDFLDQPLNDGPWLEQQLKAILGEADRNKQLARIAEIVKWENPGPGGYYDDLGNGAKEPHLVPGKPWAEDPGFVDSPQDEYAGNPNVPQDPLLGEPAAAQSKSAVRLSWLDTAQTLFRAPLRMRYENLDPNAVYKLRVTYAGRFRPTMKLTANNTVQIHGPLPQKDPVWPQEFAIPKEATKGGTLDLRWEKTQGRGCQVAEVWLIKQ
ncbi:MAG: hypothetical protein HZB26_25365 [Candidatus Hydrogenedentes bacterium]|nr:hypothetical protein [Candidatus Hydrogenedentota bacterium]